MTAINSQRMQSVDSSVDSREAYADRTNDEIIPKKKKRVYQHKKNRKLINYDELQKRT